MNPIANWARQHIVAARLLIALLHIYVFVSAIYLSQLLANTGILFSFNHAIFLAGAIFCVVAITGQQRKKINDHIVRKRLQRFRFLLMGICCTLLVVSFFSSQAVSKYSIASTTLAAFTKTEKKEKPNYESYSDKKAFYKDLKVYYRTLSKNDLRKELHLQLKDLKKNRQL